MHRSPTVPAMLLCLVTLGACAQAPASARATATVPKPPVVGAKEWGSEPKEIPASRRHEPKYITVHHAGVLWKAGDDPAAKLRGLQRYGQKEKNWPDVPYHFLIAPDGRIFEGRSIGFEPESNTKYDLRGNVGVELWGNFEAQRVNEAQLRSLVKLSAWLCDQYGIDPKTIRGHRDVAETACPGKDFYRYLKEGDVVEWVRATLKGEAAAVQLKKALDGGPSGIIAP